MVQGTGVQSFVAACLVAALLFLVQGGVPSATAYSGAQAEAQSDPVSDPYTFPNIRLCCQGRRPYGRPDWNRPSPPPGGSVADVSCGMKVRDTYNTVGEALAALKGGGTIRVAPGAPCDVSGLRFEQGISVVSSGYGAGGRARLVGGTCMTVATVYASNVVSFNGVDLDVCVGLQSGRLDLNQVNVAWRGAGSAIQIAGGIFSASDSTAVSRDTVITASQGTMVSLSGGQYASLPDAEQVIRLSVESAVLQNVFVKGGKIGVRFDRMGSQSTRLYGMKILRAEPGDPYLPATLSVAGVVFGGYVGQPDLPVLPGRPGASVTIENSDILGYSTGVVFAPGSRGVADNVRIAFADRGIQVAAGAIASLRNNRISGTKKGGIVADAGARGDGYGNDIKDEDCDCVCYGGDCSSRSNVEFGKGSFRLVGTRCDD